MGDEFKIINLGKKDERLEYNSKKIEKIQREIEQVKSKIGNEIYAEKRPLNQKIIELQKQIIKADENENISGEEYAQIEKEADAKIARLEAEISSIPKKIEQKYGPELLNLQQQLNNAFQEKNNIEKKIAEENREQEERERRIKTSTERFEQDMLKRRAERTNTNTTYNTSSQTSTGFFNNPPERENIGFANEKNESVFENNNKMREDERRRIEERFARELESEKRKMQTRSSNREKMLGAAAIVAPEAGPAIGVAEERMHERDEKKLQDKEEKLMDKEEKALDKSGKNDKRAMDRIKDLQRGAVNGARGWMERGPGILIILSIVAYFFDFITNFTRPPNYTVIMAYGIMIIIAVIMTKTSTRKWLDGDFVGFFAVIAFTIIFPWVVNAFRENISYQWLVDLLGAFLLFPPVIVYLMSKYPDNSVGHKLYRGIIIFLFIYAFLQLLASPTFQGTYEGGKPTITHATDLMKGFLGNVFNTATGVVTNVEKSFQMAVAKATGQKYEGEEEEQRGILIESVKPVEKNYFTSSDVYVQARIKAQNLVGEVGVRTRCYVKDKTNGTTYPEILTMVNDDENIIDCHIGRLPKGNYQIYVTATFIFITDADIQYYFVDEKTRPELYDSMKIPDKAVATYTGGPVEVGLPSLNQPLRISADGSNRYVGDYPFGVSLTNKWSQGKVNRGINYTLEIPAGFELDKCNRRLLGEFNTGTDNRNAYVFDTNNQNIKETFDSVTCRMRVIDAGTVLSGDLVAIKTFNARAVYEYTVEGTTSVNIQQDYYGG